MFILLSPFSSVHIAQKPKKFWASQAQNFKKECDLEEEKESNSVNLLLCSTATAAPKEWMQFQGCNRLTDTALKSALAFSELAQQILLWGLSLVHQNCCTLIKRAPITAFVDIKILGCVKDHPPLTLNFADGYSRDLNRII